MSWGTELWDQFDQVGNHTEKGIEFCERYIRFLKEKCAIEQEYASKLKKLVKSYQPKKKEEEDYQFTYTRAFVKMIHEVNDMAGQHDEIVEGFSGKIIKQLQQLVQELKQDRKKLLQDGAKQYSSLQNQLGQLDKSKKAYEKSFKDMEKAHELYLKADADVNQTKAEVQKAKQLHQTKTASSEDLKSEYAAELQKTNAAQTEHYHTLMPNIFKELQDLDVKRIEKLKESIQTGATVERGVIPIFNRCLDGMMDAAESISHEADSKLVVEKYKSGFQPPGDIPFEDLSAGNATQMENNSHTPRPAKSDTLKGTMSGGKSKKRGGLLGIFSSSKSADEVKEDYSHLPPNQQKKKLNEKIAELKAKIAKETAERDGMIKMRDVYEKNPQMGDAKSLDKQLEDNAQNLDKLKQQLTTFEGYMKNSDRPNGNGGGSQTSLNQPAVSLSHSSSDVNVSDSGNRNQNSNPTTPQSARHSHYQQEESPNSGASHEQRPEYHEQDSFDDLDDEEFPVLGTCRALYPFDASSEGSVSMYENEEFHIVDSDAGDGWTRVRRMNNGEEGFVPTSYIDCTYYS